MVTGVQTCALPIFAVFYIPEVDGVGLVHRGFPGVTPIGLRFGQLAETVGGGKQVPGFQGISFAYLRSKKLFAADGGWERIVWMTSEIKKRVYDAIPPELRDKIPTENEVKTVEELKQFLIKVGHPIVKRWKKAEEAKPAEEKKPEAAAPAPAAPTPPTAPAAPAAPAVPMAVPMPAAPTFPVAVTPTAAGITFSVTLPLQLMQPTGTPITITFKNVKIRAEKLVIKRAEEKK